MTVYRRGKRWVCQVHDPATGKPKQVGTFDTKRDATAAEATARLRGRLAATITIAEWRTEWLQRFPRPKRATNLHLAERTRRFAEEHGRRRLDALSDLEARAWAQAHPSTVADLRTMFNDARRANLLERNPFTGLGPKKGRGRRDLPSGWLSAEEVDRIADCALRAVEPGYGPTMRAIVLFAAYTGVRPGELYALRLSDLGDDTLEVTRAANSRSRTIDTPKNGRGRIVVLPARAREAALGVPRRDGQELLFESPRGVQLWASTFGRYWDKTKATAGKPHMDFYELRHFCATHLLELGLSPADVAVQLGHTDGGALVMSTYGHPDDAKARARIKAALDGHDQDAGGVTPIRKVGGA